MTTLIPAALRDRDGMAVIGRTLHDLRGIRFENGEGGNADSAATAATGDGTADAADAGAAGATDAAAQAAAATAAAASADASTTTTTDSTQTVDGSADGGKTFSSDYVEKLRKEAAGYRTRNEAEAKAAAEKATKELTQSLGKALGFVTEDADPAKLLAQAQQEKETAAAEAASSKRELAVVRAATKPEINGKISELSDSRGFQEKLADLDPTASDFASQVDALVKQTVDSNPARFRNAQVAASSGNADHTGDSATQLTREQLKAMSPADRLKAHREGRTRTLLGK